MTRNETIKCSAITSIAVAANTIYTVATENSKPKQLMETSTEPTTVEILDTLTKQLNRI